MKQNKDKNPENLPLDDASSDVSAKQRVEKTEEANDDAFWNFDALLPRAKRPVPPVLPKTDLTEITMDASLDKKPSPADTNGNGQPIPPRMHPASPVTCSSPVLQTVEKDHASTVSPRSNAVPIPSSPFVSGTRMSSETTQTADDLSSSALQTKKVESESDLFGEQVERLRMNIPKYRGTPGDVKPQMRQPVLDYAPAHSFIRRVQIFRWPESYRFYDRFCEDAVRYASRRGEEAPFAPFYAYLPQYAQMTAPQLNYYFWWREQFSKGNCLRTEYSYLFLYVYELINLPVQTVSAQKGRDIMCRLWMSYRDAFPRLDRYMGEWICDWCLIHRLPPPLEQIASALPSLPEKVSLKEFYMRYDDNGQCPLDETLLDMLTSYHWQTSKYVTPQNRALFRTHLYHAVLAELRRLWAKGDEPEKMLGLREVTQTRDAFSGALCGFSAKRRIDVTYVSFSRSYPLQFLITDLFKFAENQIRAHLGIRARLNVGTLPEENKTLIRAYFNKYLPPKSKTDRAAAKERAEQLRQQTDSGVRLDPSYAALYEAPKGGLDIDRARKIEQRSWETTRLLVPQDEETTVADRSNIVSDSVRVSDSVSNGTSHDSTGQSNTRDVSQKSTQTVMQNSLGESGKERTQTGANASSVSSLCSPSPLTEESAPSAGLLHSDTDGYRSLVAALSPLQFAVLQCVINGEFDQMTTLCREMRLTADGVISEINDLGTAYTADAIIEPNDAGEFVLIADYAAEVTDAVIGRMEDEGGESDA